MSISFPPHCLLISKTFRLYSKSPDDNSVAWIDWCGQLMSNWFSCWAIYLKKKKPPTIEIFTGFFDCLVSCYRATFGNAIIIVYVLTMQWFCSESQNTKCFSIDCKWINSKRIYAIKWTLKAFATKIFTTSQSLFMSVFFWFGKRARAQKSVHSSFESNSLYNAIDQLLKGEKIFCWWLLQKSRLMTSKSELTAESSKFHLHVWTMSLLNGYTKNNKLSDFFFINYTHSYLYTSKLTAVSVNSL